MFRNWGVVKKWQLIITLLELLGPIISIIFPAASFVFLVINLILLFTPMRYIGTGFLFFFLWFIGLNHFLGNFLLTDPRGVWSGDLYLTMTDHVILVIFFIALVRTVYHIIISYPTFKKYESYDISFIQKLNRSLRNKKGIGYKEDRLIEDGIEKGKKTIKDAAELLRSDPKLEDEFHIEKEKQTLTPILIISVIFIIISLFIKPAWRQQAIDDLKNGFAAVNENNIETARSIAVKYYNTKKILNTGDVFYLNGLVEETESRQTAIEFLIKAVNWYDHHKSWISQNYHGDSYYNLSLMYMNGNYFDYYKAGNAIKKALKLDPNNMDYQTLQAKVKENILIYEKEENIGFFKRVWNKTRSRF